MKRRRREREQTKKQKQTKKKKKKEKEKERKNGIFKKKMKRDKGYSQRSLKPFPLISQEKKKANQIFLILFF